MDPLAWAMPLLEAAKAQRKQMALAAWGWRERPPPARPVGRSASQPKAISCPGFQCGLRIQVSEEPGAGFACVGAADRDQLLVPAGVLSRAPGAPTTAQVAGLRGARASASHLSGGACWRGRECGRGRQLRRETEHAQVREREHLTRGRDLGRKSLGFTPREPARTPSQTGERMGTGGALLHSLGFSASWPSIGGRRTGSCSSGRPQWVGMLR